MNSVFQLDLHPDADSLNAFAEQALGVAEREQILAHMTRCSRCRQVIFLAHKAAEAEDLETQSALPSRGWRWGWRLGWVPTAAMAAALAAALTVVVTMHPRHTAPAPEMAKVVPQNAQTAPVPLREPPAGAALKPVPPVEANSAAGSLRFTASRRPPEELALEAAPSAALQATPGAGAYSPGENNAVRTPSTESVQMRTQQEFPSQFNPEPAVGGFQQRQRMTGALSANANATGASQESMKAAMGGAPVGQNAPAFTAVSRVSKQGAPTASFDNGAREAIARSAASLNANLPILPSGLTAISAAVTQQRTLAIDVAGALFLSEDEGKHWEPVTRQWTGRPVKVRVQAIGSGTVFQLTNTSGFSWTSADGKTWTVQ